MEFEVGAVLLACSSGFFCKVRGQTFRDLTLSRLRMKRLGRYAWQACPCPAFPRLRLSRGEPFRLTCSLARFLRWPVCNDAELIAKSPSKRSKSLESWLDVSGAFDWAGRASSHRRARTFAPSRWSGLVISSTPVFGVLESCCLGSTLASLKNPQMMPVSCP